MEYKEVRIAHTSASPNEEFICIDLYVDNIDSEYDIDKMENKTRFRIGNKGEYFCLNTVLLMNINEPKETLCRFFKLLMLQ
jgi:hypothetical protein